MVSIDSITNFLIDKNRKLSSKAMVIIAIILSTIIVDNSTGFTYNYRIDRRLDQIKEINFLIINPSTDSMTREYAISLRDNIINRRSLLDHFISLFRSINSNRSKSDQKMTPNEIPKKIDSPIKNYAVFLFTAGGCWFLLSIFAFFTSLFEIDSPFFSRVMMGIALCIAISFIGFLLYGLCSIVPLISKNTWFWNYFVNVFAQALSIIAFFKSVPKDYGHLNQK